MRTEKMTIWEREEYTYPAGNFIPCLHVNVHDDGQVRPAILIAPGGAYVMLTPGEVDGLACQFYDLGYNTFILLYTNNVTLDHPVETQPLKDISRAIQMIRKHAASLLVDPNRIILTGYSAGGHLVGSIAVHHEHPLLHTNEQYEPYSNRPDAVMMNYALVSMEDIETSLNDHAFFSLQNHIKKSTPPILLIHGMADPLVPPRHALMMAAACLEKNVPCELHIYQNVGHGVGAHSNNREKAGQSSYVLEQLLCSLNAMTEDEVAAHEAVWGPLKKGMSESEFVQTASTQSLMRLYMKGMNLTPADAARIMQAQPMKPNPNTENIPEMQHQWIQMVT